MHNVGHHLQVEALRRRGALDADIYARSAYNRYYYGIFLMLRSFLGSIDNSWIGTPHKNYPGIIGVSLIKRIKNIEKRVARLDDYESVSECQRIRSLALNLSSLVQQAYAIRVVADYNPEIIVVFSSDQRFSLNGTDITEAHSWNEKVSAWTAAIGAFLDENEQ